MGRGFADEAIVAVKFLADEDSGDTGLRAKLRIRVKMAKAKGGLI
jgi:hypothetical protein